jgi:hypothetical protein
MAILSRRHLARNWSHPVLSWRNARPHRPLNVTPAPTSSTPALCDQTQAPTRPVWQEALASRKPEALLKLNGYHLSAYLRVAPAFSDLVRELRFVDLGESAKAAFIAEVLTALRDAGPDAARTYCWRAVAQLQAEYARRHKSSIQDPDAGATTPPTW